MLPPFLFVLMVGIYVSRQLSLYHRKCQVVSYILLLLGY